MKIVLTSLFMVMTVLLAGCGSFTERADPFPDPFLTDADFAARRDRESRDFEDIAAPRLLLHATHVLLDLDCRIIEASREQGFVAAAGRSELYMPEKSGSQLAMLSLPSWFKTCGGGEALVSVKALDTRRVRVRASFADPSDTGPQVFFTLLQRSLDATEPGS